MSLLVNAESVGKARRMGSCGQGKSRFAEGDAYKLDGRRRSPCLRWLVWGFCSLLFYENLEWRQKAAGQLEEAAGKHQVSPLRWMRQHFQQKKKGHFGTQWQGGNKNRESKDSPCHLCLALPRKIGV